MKNYLLSAATAVLLVSGAQQLKAQNETSDKATERQKTEADIQKKQSELQETQSEMQKKAEELQKRSEEMREDFEKKFREYDEIIIKRKDGDKDARIVIEIKDDEVKVNGKPIEEFTNDALAVIRRNQRHYRLEGKPFTYNKEYFGDESFGDEKAFLGVAMEKTADGIKIISVSEKSAAEAAGLKKDDIILKVNATEVKEPGELSAAINRQKPDDKVVIVYKRDGKEKMTTVKLGKRKKRLHMNAPVAPIPPVEPMSPMMPAPPRAFNFDRGQFEDLFSSNKPRLGIKAQDLEEGKGVKVLEVDEASAAEKAGIRKDDIITSFDDQQVNSVDELVKAARDARDKTSVKTQVKRNGKTQTIEIKTPKKLKTSSL